MITQTTPIEKIRLICIPFAGGSFYVYRDFETHLDDFIQLISPDLPGHGQRIHEPLLSDMERMAEDLLEQVSSLIDGPYALYGHSLGAGVAYLMTVKSVQSGKRPPFHLFVSGRESPSAPPRKEHFHQLPKDDFLRKVNGYGGIPPELMRESDLMDFFEPILRADFTASETYRYDHDEPIDIPITVMTGEDDDVSEDDALKWREVTTMGIKANQFTGGHFFIFDHLARLCSIFNNTLKPFAADKNNAIL